MSIFSIASAWLEPRAIVPTHYDDFFRPLGEAPRFSFNVNLTGFCDDVHRASREPQIHVMTIGAK